MQLSLQKRMPPYREEAVRRMSPKGPLPGGNTVSRFVNGEPESVLRGRPPRGLGDIVAQAFAMGAARVLPSYFLEGGETVTTLSHIVHRDDAVYRFRAQSSQRPPLCGRTRRKRAVPPVSRVPPNT